VDTVDTVGAVDAVDTAGAAVRDEGHPRKWLILAAVSMGMFMTLLDVTIVNIAIPAIITDLDTTVTNASWVINAYSLTLAVLFLSMGGLADKFGRKLLFLLGLSVFTVFSLLCGLAPSIEWLIVFRVGQGVGGAAMTPLSLAILLSVFPRRQHGMAVGIWGALSAMAAAVGPSLGGLLIEYGAWHWVFFINVPVGAVALVLGWSVIPKVKEALASSRVDVVGVLISAVGLFCLVLALIQANDWGWTSPPILGLFAVAIASYPLFAWWELRTPSPMFDFGLLRIRPFAAANTAMMFIGAAMGGALFLLVIFLVIVLGYSELQAALAITPMPLTALILAPNIGRLTDRVGPRFLAAIGATFFGIGLLLLSGLGAQSSLWDATWRVVFIGIGMGFTFPTLASAAMSSLPPARTGVGSGALNTLRQVGFSLGVAVLVAIFTSQMTANVTEAVRQSQRFVNSQAAIPAAARTAIDARLAQAADMAQKGGTRPVGVDSLLAAPQAAPGTPQAQMEARIKATIGAIFEDNIAKSFTWAFYASALLAFIAIVPALMTGRRLGEDEGSYRLADERRTAGTHE